jgi:hypothetical protein
MGGGQPYPMMLKHSAARMAVFTRLFGLKCFERIAGWTNGTQTSPLPTDARLIRRAALFMGFAPKLHGYYRQTVDDVFDWDATQDRAQHLQRNFLAAFSVFTTATFNFGPRTVTFPHIDFGNLAWGWCAITALGWFDANLGGHLILWDLKLIIRFPPGSTILIPSAILRHSNIKIRPWETRFSFTQFTPAAMFRWAYNGCRTDKDVEAKMTPETEAQRREDRMRRWQEGVKMYRVWNSVPNGP